MTDHSYRICTCQNCGKPSSWFIRRRGTFLVPEELWLCNECYKNKKAVE